MPRRPRTDFPGAIHHVMNRGVDHQAIFFSDHDRLDFGRQLSVAHDRFDVDFLAYCLMGNHFHLLVRSNTARLSDAMRHIGTTYVRHLNDRLGPDGPLFRGRYCSKLVCSDAYFSWVIRYIHRNPLVIAGERPLSQYRWSSYPAYLGLRARPTFLDVGPALAAFNGDLDALVRFTTDERLALDEWRSDDVRQLIDLAIAEDELENGGDDRQGRLARTIFSTLVDLLPIPDLARERRSARAASDGAARMAARRAALRAQDPVVARIAERVLRHLGLDEQMGSGTSRSASEG